MSDNLLNQISIVDSSKEPLSLDYGEIFEYDDKKKPDDDIDFVYDLTPYHFNMDVQSLLRRYREKKILIPSFQRNYIWKKEGASMFIDSILRGLPSPSLFFYEEEPQKYLVIDGQQRLLTLHYFIKGIYPDKKQHQNVAINTQTNKVEMGNIIDPEEGWESKGRTFTLTGNKIHKLWYGKTYAELTEDQQGRINDTYIFIVNMKQSSPTNDNSSMFLIFERINTGATPLNAQQVRLCVSHGMYAQLLWELSSHPQWQERFNLTDNSGNVSELILRFFALYFMKSPFKGNMRKFLDDAISNNRNLELYPKTKLVSLFENSFRVMSETFTNENFMVNRAMNGYLFLITWVAVAHCLEHLKGRWPQDKDKILQVFNSMLDQDDVKGYVDDTRRNSDSDKIYSAINFSKKWFLDGLK